VSAPDIDELFAQTLSGDYEDEAPWEAVCALRHLGTREVFEKATEWCESDNPLARARGADVLSQLGKTIEHRSNSFPEESYSAVAALAQQETHTRPLSSAIAALGHLDDPLGVPLIVQFYTHPSSEVRFAVACALGALPNEPRSAATLLKLMRDTDEDIRDWATFGLGVQGEIDSPEMRDALVLCLGDSNEDVREEAMAGLAKRKDRRVLEVLLAALEQPTMTDRVIEAACMMLDLQNERKGWKAGNYAAALRKQFSMRSGR
jgi:HEAT repeat protein